MNQWPRPCQGRLASGLPPLAVAQCGADLGLPGVAPLGVAEELTALAPRSGFGSAFPRSASVRTQSEQDHRKRCPWLVCGALIGTSGRRVSPGSRQRGAQRAPFGVGRDEIDVGKENAKAFLSGVAPFVDPCPQG